MCVSVGAFSQEKALVGALVGAFSVIVKSSWTFVWSYNQDARQISGASRLGHSSTIIKESSEELYKHY